MRRRSTARKVDTCTGIGKRQRRGCIAFEARENIAGRFPRRRRSAGVGAGVGVDVVRRSKVAARSHRRSRSGAGAEPEPGEVSGGRDGHNVKLWVGGMVRRWRDGRRAVFAAVVPSSAGRVKICKSSGSFFGRGATKEHGAKSRAVIERPTCQRRVIVPQFARRYRRPVAPPPLAR